MNLVSVACFLGAQMNLVSVACFWGAPMMLVPGSRLAFRCERFMSGPSES